MSTRGFVAVVMTLALSNTRDLHCSCPVYSHLPYHTIAPLLFTLPLTNVVTSDLTPSTPLNNVHYTHNLTPTQAAWAAVVARDAHRLMAALVAAEVGVGPAVQEVRRLVRQTRVLVQRLDVGCCSRSTYHTR